MIFQIRMKWLIFLIILPMTKNGKKDYYFAVVCPPQTTEYGPFCCVIIDGDNTFNGADVRTPTNFKMSAEREYPSGAGRKGNLNLLSIIIFNQF